MRVIDILTIAVVGLAVNSSADKSRCFTDCEPIQLVDNQILIGTNVGGRSVYLALGSAQESAILLDSRGTKRDVFSIENKIIAIDQYKSAGIATHNQLGCLPAAGVFGRDLLGSCRHSTMINFDTMQICHDQHPVSIEHLTNSGFKEVRSRYISGSFEIAVTINWKDYWFKLDTSYEGMFVMPHRRNLSFQKDRFVERQAFDIVTRRVSNDKTYINKGVWFDGIGYNASIVVTESKSESKCGVGFIKGFNWLFDYDNQRVYYRKNSLSLGNQSPVGPHIILKSNNYLIIVSKPINDNNFTLGDTIFSANATTVDSSTVCQVLSTLTNSPDWSKMEIKTNR
jgi:hypothetical protein